MAETLRQRGNSDVTNNLVAGPKLVQVLRMSKMANMVKLNPGELVKAFRRVARKLGCDKSEQRFQEVLFAIGTLGLASQRRLAAMQTQLDNLSSATRRLESDYERLFIRSLRSRKARESLRPSFDALEEKMTACHLRSTRPPTNCSFDASLELPPTIPAPFGGHRTAAAYGCTELPSFRVRAHIAD